MARRGSDRVTGTEGGGGGEGGYSELVYDIQKVENRQKYSTWT